MNPLSIPSLPMLQVSGLTIRRGERLLFEGLDLALAGGEAVFLRGANGSGKSTLLMAVAGIVRPDAGTIVLNLGTGEAPARTGLHWLGYQHGLKPRLKVLENLAFWRTMHGETGLPLVAALKRVGLSSIADLETGYLSSGQLRRLSLARLLVSHRSLWLLDEPTAALDAAGEKLLAELVDEHLQQGGAALIATHHDLVLATQMNATATKLNTVWLGAER